MSLNNSLENTTIHDPLTVPCLGVAQSRYPAAMRPGEYLNLANMRVDYGRMFARGGIVEIPQGVGNGLRTTKNLGGYAASDVGTLPTDGFRGAFRTSGGAIVAAYSSGSYGTHFYISYDASEWHRVVFSHTNFSGRWTSGASRYNPSVSGSGRMSFVEIDAPRGLVPTYHRYLTDKVVLASDGSKVWVVYPQLVQDSVTREIISGGYVESHRPCDAPLTLSSVSTVAYWSKFLPVSTVGASVSASGFTNTTDGQSMATGKMTLTFKRVPTGTPSSDYVSFMYPNTYNMDGSRDSEIVLIFDIAGYRNLLSDLLGHFSIYIKSDADTAARGLVYQPSDPARSSVKTYIVDDAEYWVSSAKDAVPNLVKKWGDAPTESSPDIAIVSFPLSNVQWSVSADYMSAALETIRGIEIRPVDDSSQLSGVAKLIGICLSGKWQGLGQWAVSNASSFGLSESPAVELMNGRGCQARAIGVSTDYVFEIPEVPIFQYDYLIPAEGHAKKIDGVVNWSYDDTCVVYRREWGSNEYYRVWTQAKYSYSAPDASSLITETVYDPTGYSFTDRVANLDSLRSSWISSDLRGTDHATFDVPWRPPDVSMGLPGPATTSVPPFKTAVFANDRLFAGSSSKVYGSEMGIPTRHASVSSVRDGTFDVSGPVVRSVQSDVKALKAVSGSMLGSNQIYIWTDTDTAALDAVNPFQPINRLMEVGCSNSETVVSFKGATWVLDDKLQYRIYNNGGTGEKSRGFIDNILSAHNGAFSRGSMVAAWHNDRLYATASSPNKDSPVNDIVLVYDDRNGAWTIDEIPWGWVTFSKFLWTYTRDAGSPIDTLLAFTPDGRVFMYDWNGDGMDWASPSDDANTPVPWRIVSKITTRPLTSGPFAPLVVGRIGILCTPSPGGESRITKDVLNAHAPGRRYANPSQSFVKLNDGGWAWSSQDPGSWATGPAVVVSIESDVESGWEPLAIIAEVGNKVGGQS